MLLKRVSLWRVLAVGVCGYAASAIAQDTPDAGGLTYEYQALLDQYCVLCHNSNVEIGDMVLDQVNLAHVGDHAHILEEVVTKIRGGSMPPSGFRARTPAATSASWNGWKASSIRRLPRIPTPGVRRSTG